MQVTNFSQNDNVDNGGDTSGKARQNEEPNKKEEESSSVEKANLDIVRELLNNTDYQEGINILEIPSDFIPDSQKNGERANKPKKAK